MMTYLPGGLFPTGYFAAGYFPGAEGTEPPEESPFVYLTPGRLSESLSASRLGESLTGSRSATNLNGERLP